MKRIFCSWPLFLAAASGSATALRAIGREFNFRSPRSLVALAVLLTLSAGCNRQKSEAKAEEKEEAVAFNAKFGLAVPKKTADFIGLQSVEVEERVVPSTNQFSAQVYSRRNGQAFATASVDKKTAESLREGTALTVTAPEGQNFKATVSKLTSLSANGTSEALLEIEDPRSALKGADYLTASVATGADKKVVSVPREALLKTIEGHFVYTLSGERLVRTAVKVGTSNESFVEITDGLYSGDQVAVQPVMTLWLAELQSLRGGKACADGH
jgi:hypothetical protein